MGGILSTLIVRSAARIFRIAAVWTSPFSLYLTPRKALGEPQKHNQPPRPAVEPGEFVPPGSSSSVDVSTDAEVQLAWLCSKCTTVSRWLQTNQPTRECHYTSEKYSVPSEIRSFEHHDDGGQLERSYLDGCHLCTLMWRSILLSLTATLPDTKSKLAQARTLTELRLSLHSKKPAPKETKIRLTLITTWKDPKDGTRGQHRPISLSPWPPPLWGPPDAAPTPFPTDEVPTCCLVSTSSDRFLDLTSQWIRECESHDQCRLRSSSTLSVPTRLLDLGPSEQQCDPRLVTNTNPEEHGLYLTLSYRWGEAGAVTLKTENKDEFVRGIQLDSLRKTIRDAIYFTKKLGFRWLWVDSLCIIQDDREDWKREAKTMADVYQNSFLTLAALGASTSSKGLFGQRDPLMYSSCRLYQSDESDGDDGEDYYAHPEKPWDILTHTFEEAPLHKRGWVTQERLLSPRTLNFGATLVWECRHSFKDEFQLSHRTRHLTLKGRFLPAEIAAGSEAATDFQVRKVFYAFWCEFFTFYMKAGLSFSGDRPIAILGAIQAIERHTGWKNIAGLWEPFLQQDLIWFVAKPLGRTSYGPTWSWLTLNNEVRSACRNPPTRYLSSVQDIVDYPATSQLVPTDQGTLPVIYLKSCLVRFSELPSPFTASDSKFHPDTPESGPGLDNLAFLTSTVVTPILEAKIGLGGRICGLVLRESRLVPGAYERLGLMWLHLGKSGIEAARVFDNAEQQTIMLA